MHNYPRQIVPDKRCARNNYSPSNPCNNAAPSTSSQPIKEEVEDNYDYGDVKMEMEIKEEDEDEMDGPIADTVWVELDFWQDLAALLFVYETEMGFKITRKMIEVGCTDIDNDYLCLYILTCSECPEKYDYFNLAWLFQEAERAVLIHKWFPRFLHILPTCFVLVSTQAEDDPIPSTARVRRIRDGGSAEAGEWGVEFWISTMVSQFSTVSRHCQMIAWYCMRFNISYHQSLRKTNEDARPMSDHLKKNIASLNLLKKRTCSSSYRPLTVRTVAWRYRTENGWSSTWESTTGITGWSES